jgi:hypothetical protein
MAQKKVSESGKRLSDRLPEWLSDQVAELVSGKWLIIKRLSGLVIEWSSDQVTNWLTPWLSY